MMILPPLVLIIAALAVPAAIAAWARMCRAEAALDAPVDARAAALADGAEARAQIRLMRAQHTARVDAARARWAAEPDTTELALVDHVSRAAASGWWLK